MIMGINYKLKQPSDYEITLIHRLEAVLISARNSKNTTVVTEGVLLFRFMEIQY